VIRGNFIDTTKTPKHKITNLSELTVWMNRIAESLATEGTYTIDSITVCFVNPDVAIADLY